MCVCMLQSTNCYYECDNVPKLCFSDYVYVLQHYKPVCVWVSVCVFVSPSLPLLNILICAEHDVSANSQNSRNALLSLPLSDFVLPSLLLPPSLLLLLLLRCSTWLTARRRGCGVVPRRAAPCRTETGDKLPVLLSKIKIRRPVRGLQCEDGDGVARKWATRRHKRNGRS